MRESIVTRDAVGLMDARICYLGVKLATVLSYLLIA